MFLIYEFVTINLVFYTLNLLIIQKAVSYKIVIQV